MQNLWNDEESKLFKSDLALRVYTSNLLGKNDELVLHGGGNTSVKSKVNKQDILYVKGSGWDLVSIKEEGFAAVDLNTLLYMAKLTTLSDTDMLSQQKVAMLDKTAPNPSVEAILHAIIPFKFVDHTHSDAVVTITNSKIAKDVIEDLYPNFLIVPYVMPGFILAQKIYEMTKDLIWDKCEGIILHNHGIFTFDDVAKKSYTKMIDAVTLAEDFIDKMAQLNIKDKFTRVSFDTRELKELVQEQKGHDIVIKHNTSKEAIYYSSQDDLELKVTKGLLTPEHIIRTKLKPLVINSTFIKEALYKYKNDYEKYFKKYCTNEIMLNPSPNYAVIKDCGIVSFGKNEKEANIIHDIVSHTIKAVMQGELLGGYVSISQKDSFEMEYWELEQNKLKK